MACGRPVAVSNAASIPEVCGDAAVYFDPYSSKDIAEKISKVLEDEPCEMVSFKKAWSAPVFSPGALCLGNS